MGWISENLTARTIVQLLSPRDGKGAGRGAKGEQRDGEAEDRDLGTGVGAGDRAGGQGGWGTGGLGTGLGGQSCSPTVRRVLHDGRPPGPLSLARP